MQAHPLSVLRGGRVAQASALHYCAKAALHSVVHWGTQYTSSTVSRLQIPLDRRTVKSIFHCNSKALQNSTVVEGKQLAFICSVALIVNRERCWLRVHLINSILLVRFISSLVLVRVLVHFHFNLVSSVLAPFQID